MALERIGKVTRVFAAVLRKILIENQQNQTFTSFPDTRGDPFAIVTCSTVGLYTNREGRGAVNTVTNTSGITLLAPVVLLSISSPYDETLANSKETRSPTAGPTEKPHMPAVFAHHEFSMRESTLSTRVVSNLHFLKRREILENTLR